MLASFPGSSLVELERRLACFVSRNTSRNVWKCSEEVQHSRSWVMTDWPASTVTGLLYNIDAQYLAAGCFCSTLSFAYGSSRNQLLFVKLVQTVTLFACWVEFLDYITVYFMSVYTYYQSLYTVLCKLPAFGVSLSELPASESAVTTSCIREQWNNSTSKGTSSSLLFIGSTTWCLNKANYDKLLNLSSTATTVHCDWLQYTPHASHLHWHGPWKLTYFHETWSIGHSFVYSVATYFNLWAGKAKWVTLKIHIIEHHYLAYLYAKLYSSSWPMASNWTSKYQCNSCT